MLNDYLIIPVYNEEERIREFLYECENHRFNYVFVVDGTDQTLSIIEDYIETKRKDTQIEIVHSNKRLGKGGAIKAGAEYIYMTKDSLESFPYIGYVDVDLSTQLTEINKMFDSLKNSKCDAVIGTRWAKGAIIITPQPLHRRVMSRCLNFIVRICFDLDITDTQCGAKVFRPFAFRNNIDLVETNGFGFDVELLWRLQQRGYTICEFPVIWRNYTKNSTVKVSCAFTILKDLIKLKLNPRKNKQ